MNKDGGCCKEGDELSQTVGFLLYFLIGWTGAGMFYYGYAGLGYVHVLIYLRIDRLNAEHSCSLVI